MDKTKQNKRLEYIDAMRGFTMILVVYIHVLAVSYKISDYSAINSFNSLLGLFRMPLFFFVSGFVLYKASQIWDLKNSITFIIKKFKVQIISTFIFLTLFSYVFNLDLEEGYKDHLKYGFWFTIVLFEFYVIYIIISTLLKKIKNKCLFDLILLVIGAFVFLCVINKEIITKVIPENIVNLVGLLHYRYLIFFFLGICIKRHFEKFKHLISNSAFNGCVILLFFVLSLIYLKTKGWNSFIFNLPYLIFVGIAGIFITFSFFYKYQDSFTKEKKVGRVLQYIGKRTLDIYLLHYFFLPRNLQMVGEWFTENINPTLEFFVSLILASLVIALCLVVSNIIRISPFLANWLFGVKQK